MTLTGAIKLFKKDHWFKGIIVSVMVLFYFYAAFLWSKWLVKDTKERTEDIVWLNKILFMINTILAAFHHILFLLWAMFGSNGFLDTLFRVLVNLVVIVGSNWYFYQITVRYGVDTHGGTDHNWEWANPCASKSKEED